MFTSPGSHPDDSRRRLLVLEDAITRAPRGAEARAAPLGGVARLIVPKDDALDPDMLRRIVSEAIISHVDLAAWPMEQIVEERERQLLVRPAWAVES